MYMTFTSTWTTFISNASPIAAMVLDAMIQHDRSEAIPNIAKHRDKFDESPMLRANLMARADVRDGAQREAVEAYLLDPQISFAEKGEFLRIFPNFSRHLSHRLLTRDRIPSMSETAHIHGAAFYVVQHWHTDPRYHSLAPVCAERLHILKCHVDSARRAGFYNVETGSNDGSY